jgi:hypothetical protein
MRLRNILKRRTDLLRDVTRRLKSGITIEESELSQGAKGRTLPRRQRLLVACDSLVLAGGLLRFERAGVALRRLGHELAFMSMAGKASGLEMTAPVLSLRQAAATKWDAVMVPGAGFPAKTIERFALLRKENFGVRVQHVLNDQSRRALFKAVNDSFQPHVVVFNNKHWPIGSFTDFEADRFHVLLGGVDPQQFCPRPHRTHPLTTGKWIIGGQAGKNPEPLVEALAHLPASIVLRLFGNDQHLLAKKYSALVDEGRLQLVGPLYGDAALSEFYRDVDCVVMTETSAGWSNLAAEAMASAVPVICTSCGTQAFATDQETALILDNPTPVAIAASVRRLMEDPGLGARMAEQGRRVVVDYSWDDYARQLLELISHDGTQHYVFSPSDGLYGKWPLSERLQGLAPLLEQASGRSVIDFGAAEGIVAREFLNRGATSLVGFEIDTARVRKANAICARWKNVEFRVADLSTWDVFSRHHEDRLQRRDIVLYLGIHHHLPRAERLNTLNHIIELANDYFAIRTRPELYESDGIDELLKAKGFHLFHDSNRTSQPDHLGLSRIYERQGDAGPAQP